MAAKIQVKIDDQGTVVADFVAFPGRSCEAAEKRLRSELARWGVVTRAVVMPKNPARITAECKNEKSAERSRCRTLNR